MYEEFIEGFNFPGELTPIDIVSDVTGLTIEELRKCSSYVIVHYNEHQWIDGGYL